MVTLAGAREILSRRTGSGQQGERACLALVLLVLLVDDFFGWSPVLRLATHNPGGEENERSAQRPRSAQQQQRQLRLRLKENRKESEGKMQSCYYPTIYLPARWERGMHRVLRQYAAASYVERESESKRAGITIVFAIDAASKSSASRKKEDSRLQTPDARDYPPTAEAFAYMRQACAPNNRLGCWRNSTTTTTVSPIWNATTVNGSSGVLLSFPRVQPSVSRPPQAIRGPAVAIAPQFLHLVREAHPQADMRSWTPRPFCGQQGGLDAVDLSGPQRRLLSAPNSDH
ncbi:hypothetical protein AOQ84DRAFT_228985 [Glonium stellatum]|uniref:Uncharacterized protein n=1 Tax=Glonium stellatum TaxID=574774 RepID=A0A8E2F821_9PEZI|nr:hypothetical protein AOQ84DRAFT_228985 [Glonium stellatum]